jgi:ribulose-phosphate 3-epimerase
MIEIIPAIMPRSLQDLEEKVTLVAHFVPMVQIDIMDGRFVKTKTWPYLGNGAEFDAVVTEDKGLPFWETVEYEIDLMVEHPEAVIDDWIAAGVARIVVHRESVDDATLESIVKMMKERFYVESKEQKKDVELGIALNISTPIDKVLPFLEDIDFIQFMGIDTIGLQGEELDERVVDVMREFHNAHPEVILSVDGGVRLENADILMDAGAQRLVSGSAIFKSANISGVINEFRKNS